MAHIIHIGNSFGVRIPKTIMQQVGFKENMDLIFKVTEEGLLISPQKQAREGWEQKFTSLKKRSKKSSLLDDFSNEFDKDDLINLDPTTGSEIKKTRPCVVISPNEMHSLNPVIVAPMTSTCKIYPTRIPVFFKKREGYIVLDQIRTIDKSQLVKLLGKIEKETAHNILMILQEMFTSR